jgi:DNA-binding beta-propeller fold protein YncE
MTIAERRNIPMLLRALLSVTILLLLLPVQDTAAQTTIPAPGFQPSGLAYDGTFLYVSENSGFRRIYRLDPKTGAVIRFVPGGA